jgi:hypothetical protein
MISASRAKPPKRRLAIGLRLPSKCHHSSLCQDRRGRDRVLPILLVSIGTRLLLYGLIVASLLGAAVTWRYRIETTGVTLDRIGEAASEPVSSRKAVA